MAGSDVLVDLAGKFVESQKGMADHTAWSDFLSDVQKKGIELSDEMKSNLALVLESMKKVYAATEATKGMENVMSDISDHTVNFMKKTKGVWDQPGWEAYLKDLQKKGIDLTDETRSYLGEILEASRKIYSVLPPIVSKAEAPKKEVKEAKATK